MCAGLAEGWFRPGRGPSRRCAVEAAVGGDELNVERVGSGWRRRDLSWAADGMGEESGEGEAWRCAVRRSGGSARAVSASGVGSGSGLQWDGVVRWICWRSLLTGGGLRF